MIQTVILAAGKGTRMGSEHPKAMVLLCGTPLLQRVVAAVLPISPKPTIVVGHKSDEVIRGTNNGYHYVLQKEQLGSGHAVACAKTDLEHKNFDLILVLTCDQPFVSTQSLIKLIDEHRSSQAVASLLTADMPNFQNDYSGFNYYSRIERSNDGSVRRVIEYKDCSEEQRTIKEVSIGGYAFSAAWLWENIDKIENNNATREFYLTELFNMATRQGAKIAAYQTQNIMEGLGVNTAEELITAQKYCS